MPNLSLRKSRRPTAIALVVLLLGLPALRAQATASAPGSRTSYRVFLDDNGNYIFIAVSPGITEDALRATLKKVADEHQDDRARDILFGYLWVIAYLEEDGRCSRTAAGRLRRYVPPRNPPPSSPPTEKDRVTIRLREARRTMQKGTLSGRGCSADK